jgi:hypothetical protein
LWFPSEEFLSKLEMIKDYISLYRSRDASWVQMKSFICKWLFSRGMTMMDIAKIMGYANHTSVIYFIKDYCDFDTDFKYDDFMSKIEQELYPTNQNGKTIFGKLDHLKKKSYVFADLSAPPESID